MYRIIYISLFIVLLGCSIEKDELKLQKEAMDDIFVALVDSLHSDFRVGFRPPMPYPKGVEITDSMRRAHDEILKKNILYYRRRLDSVRKDTSKLFIGVFDTIITFDEKHIGYPGDENREIRFDWDSELHRTEYKIDLSKFNDNPLFRFLYRTDLPKGGELWRNENINGTVRFSNIIFDKTFNYGILIGGYSCDRLCGHSGWVFIKKINGKWVINQIEINLIS